MKGKYWILKLFFVLQTYLSYSQWQQDEFIIGTYLDPTLSSNRNRNEDSLALVVAKEAGFNLLTGYRDDNYRRIDRSEEEIKYQLDLAHQLGLKMIVADDRFFHLKPFNKTKAEEVKNFYLNLEDKYKKTILGYRLMDEPIVSDTAWTLPWVRFFKEMDPQKISYINLLPVYGFGSREKYNEYLKIYLSDLNSSSNHLQVASYDFYPFLENSIRNDYFYNLEQIRKFANGRPIWYYPNISKHMEYLEPTESHLKFESFCPLAYGAKGIIYFSYESVPKQNPGKYSEALISRLGSPTKKYYIVKRINAFIKEVAGPAIIKSNYIGTYHVSNSSNFSKHAPEQILNPTSPFLSHISDNNILTGLFQDKVNKTKFYFLIINKSLSPVKNVEIYFKGLGPNSLNKFGSNYNLEPAQHEKLVVTYLNKLDKARASIKSIEGGGMVVLEAIFPEDLSQTTGTLSTNTSKKDLTIISYPNPAKENALIRYTLKQPGPVKIKLYNMLGQEVQSLINEVKELEGEYFVNLPTTKLAVGLYTCVLETKQGKVSTKILRVPG